MVGGGIAGVSAAAPLAASGASVLLVEAEPTLAYHTTGRSAAIFIASYGGPGVRALSLASWPTFEATRDSDEPLVSPLPLLWVARSTEREALDKLIADARSANEHIELLVGAALAEVFPPLRLDVMPFGALTTSTLALDVAGLHQHFVREVRANGGEIRRSSRLTGLAHRADGRWSATFGSVDATVDTTVDASVVVNAAGAWGDQVAKMAGIRPLGLRPLRRTAFMVEAPHIGPLEPSEWPMVCALDSSFYFKPDGSQLLCSLVDETPDVPRDARPEELDIALAIEHINEATTLGIRSVRSSWAGLRTFTPDRVPAIGFDPDLSGFFWLVGQGGVGIQTSPAAGRLAAALIAGTSPEIDPSSFDPGRFRR